MQSYKFNFQIDSTDYKNIVINDLIDYPIYNVETPYHDFTEIYVTQNASENKSVIEIENASISDNIKFGRILKVLTGPDAGKLFDIELVDLSADPASSVIHVFGLMTNNSSPFSFSILTHVFEDAIIGGIAPDNSAISREMYTMFVYIKSHEVAGTKLIDINVDSKVDVNSWEFYTDNGGYHTMKVYCLRRFSLKFHLSPIPYQFGEFIWTIKNNKVTYYKSIKSDNIDDLSVITSWEPLNREPTELELSNHFNISERDVDNIYQYSGNFFLDQKLITLTDKLNTLIDCCKCIDPCAIQDNLKLAMYIQQINSLKKLGLYNKAQESYEKAIQLAQNLT